MTTSSSQQLFQNTILPIMRKVKESLQSKKMEEMEKHNSSFRGLLAGAAGPDGGMASTEVYKNTINYVGEWNSKDLEDYRKMVEKELVKRKIKVTPEIIRMMERQMIKDRIPRSSTEYILRSLTSNSSICAVLSSAQPTSKYDQAVEEASMKKYNASAGLQLFATGIGVSVDLLATCGLGSGFQLGRVGKITLSGLLSSVDVSLFVKELNEEGNIDIEVPQWMKKTCGIKSCETASTAALKRAADIAQRNGTYYYSLIETCEKSGKEYVRDQYGKTHRLKDVSIKYLQYLLFLDDCLAELKSRGVVYKPSLKNTQESNTQPSHSLDTSNYEGQVFSSVASGNNPQNAPSTSPKSYDPSVSSPEYDGGWTELWKSIGGTPMTDFLKNPGVAIAMIPDVLFGMFSGNSKTLGFNKSTIMPIASIFASFFVKNNLMKLLLLSFGAANLCAKSAQEITERDNAERGEKQYLRYEDQELSPRIKNLQLSGNGIVMDVDGIPTFTSLPPSVIDAHNKGCLPLNVIANTLLDRYDEANKKAVQKFEEQQDAHVSRGIR